MASTITNPLRQAEPFEEINVSTGAPPDELEEYYIELERQELERRLSRNKSRWSRKSVRGIDLRIEELSRARERAQRDREANRAADMTPPREDSRDHTPEPAPLPHWQQRDSIYRPAGAVEYRRYDLHNPTGPRWYINHHLLPKTGVRPASVFSPNFPAFPSTPHIPAAALDAKTRRHAMTLDSAKPGAVDPQGSPSGEKWLAVPNGHVARSAGEERPLARNATMPASLSMRMAPSPLSQSVSTLVPDEPSPYAPQEPHVHVARKLSKRGDRPKGLRGLFSSRSDNDAPAPLSAALPISRSTTSLRQEDVNRPRPVSVMGGSYERQKRSSVLGKLTKKFSVAARRDPLPPSMVVERPRNGMVPQPNGTARPFLGVSSAEAAMSSRTSLASQQERRSVSPEKPRARTNSEVRRVPPPVLEPHTVEDGRRALPADPALRAHPPATGFVEHGRADSDGRSSPDISFQIGNLMIANPDDHLTSTSQASTPRAPNRALRYEPPPPPLPPLHANHFQEASSDSTTSIPFSASSRLQVVNPSAPTPTPERQSADNGFGAPNRTSLPPLPFPAQPPSAASSRTLPNLPDGAPIELRDSPAAAGFIGQSSTYQPVPNGAISQKAPTTLVHAQYSDPSKRLSGQPGREVDSGVIMVDGEHWEVRPVRKRHTSNNGPSNFVAPTANGSSQARPAEDSSATQDRIVERYRLQRMDSSGPPPTPPPKPARNPRRPNLDRRASSDRENPSPKKAELRPSSGRESATQRLAVPLGPRPASDVPAPSELEPLAAREAWEAERLRKGVSAYIPDDARVARSREGSPEKPGGARRQGSTETSQSLGSNHTAFVMTPPFAGPPNPLPQPVSEVTYPTPKARPNGLPRQRAQSERRLTQQ